MVKILIENPLLLLLMVASVGYPLGKVKFFGMSLGSAAVLFVGLALSSLHPDITSPPIVYIMGQALFMYTIGLAAGPSFTTSFRRNGVRNNLFALAILGCSTAVCIGLAKYQGIKPAIAAGIFCGSLTSSPALGGALETIKQIAAPESLKQLLAEPVVGFSIAYPMGVIGFMLTINFWQKFWKVDYRAETNALRRTEPREELVHTTVKIHKLDDVGLSIRELSEKHGWSVLFGRVKRENHLFLATPDTVLEQGDLVMTVGVPDQLEHVAKVFGERRSKDRLCLDRTEYDYRRVFVSNPLVAGRSINDLRLNERFGEVVTRVRRGDTELIPHGEMVLELGDVVRVLVHKSEMEEVTSFFGNSYRKVSEVDVMTFSLGLVIGLTLGMIPFPFPGGGNLLLGFAGGPLVVGILLGTFGRTKGMVWTLPYSVNLTLRQVGLLLFLAGVGTRSGYTFVSTLSQGGGATLFMAGVVITVLTASLALWIGYRVMKIPMSLLIGLTAGIHTSISAVAYVKEQACNDLPDQGYTCVFPFATIAKIILVHVVIMASG